MLTSSSASWNTSITYFGAISARHCLANAVSWTCASAGRLAYHLVARGCHVCDLVETFHRPVLTCRLVGQNACAGHADACQQAMLIAAHEMSPHTSCRLEPKAIGRLSCLDHHDSARDGLVPHALCVRLDALDAHLGVLSEEDENLRGSTGPMNCPTSALCPVKCAGPGAGPVAAAVRTLPTSVWS
jgi:hypothetical protein